MINKKCKHCVKTFTEQKIANGLDRDFNIVYREIKVEQYKCYHPDVNKPITNCDGCKRKKGNGWFNR